MRKILWTVFSFLILVFVGCSSAPRYLPSGKVVEIPREKTPVKAKIGAKEIRDTGSLYGTINLYLGTPYRYGGIDADGMDCSGFVQTVFNESVGLELPRTVAQQWDFANPIDDDQLAFGDLVFFRTTNRKKPSHVGIYIGGNKFAHASSSLGVTITSFSDPYWKKRYVGAKRIINR
ncbi:hypothetical protein DRQ33_03575 [bacterium]|nr:MAG: hypothetical protein DRQ33_03575 [bacterium]